MAKRKKSNVGMYLTLATVLLSVLGLCLFLFLNSAQLYIGDKTYEDLVFTGSQIAFGYEGKVELPIIGSFTKPILSFSFFNFLPLLLVIVGLVLSLISKNNKVLGLVGGGTIILAAAFFIFSNSLVVLTPDLKDAVDTLGKLNINITFKQTIGAYLAATTCGLAGICSIVKTVF